MPAIKRVVLVHGGAGDIPEDRVERSVEGVKKAAIAGYKKLSQTSSSLDAVEAAINDMEDNDIFNAGKGSVLNAAGEVSMDALITEGRKYDAGGVTLVRNVAHPISLARMVMEKSPHTLMGGEGAFEFAKKNGVPIVADDVLVTPFAIQELEEHKRSGEEPGIRAPKVAGTVGCVVVDSTGHVSSGTSTGGVTGKLRGRIGDTPIPGSGGYSDDRIGAVSTTGHGDSIVRYNLALRILMAMELGKTAQAATTEGCNNVTTVIGNAAGAITVSIRGEVGIAFTSSRMPWAYVKDGEIHFGINPGQHQREPLNL